MLPIVQRKKSPVLDDAVTAFVRARLLERFDSRRGESIKSMAAKAGLKPSAISQVKDGVHGVGHKIENYARLLGYRDVVELQRAAYTWWLARLDRRAEEARQEIAARKRSPRSTS